MGYSNLYVTHGAENAHNSIEVKLAMVDMNWHHQLANYCFCFTFNCSIFLVYSFLFHRHHLVISSTLTSLHFFIFMKLIKTATYRVLQIKLYTSNLNYPSSKQPSL